MSEEAGAAPAAAEPVSVPEAPSEASEQTEIEVTPRASLDRAFDAVEQAEREAAPAEATPAKAVKPTDAAPTAEGGQPRDEHGKFKAKDAAPETPAGDEPKPDTAQAADVEGKKEETAKAEEDKPAGDTPFAEPPSRFSPDAKAAWKDAPAPVQAEIHRAVAELEKGIEKYRTP